MNVLVIAPHPDDESIGCGGALSLHARQGDRVAVVFLSSGELGLKHLAPEEAWRIRESEAQAAAEVLGADALSFLRRPDWSVGQDVEGAAELLAPIVHREAPELIYLPHPDEWHPDHRAALPVVRAALRRDSPEKHTLLSYEVWTPLGEHDHVEDISAVMARKLRAIRCYQSQLGAFRYDRAVEGLNQYRGALAAHCDYAEVFRYLEPETHGAPQACDGAESRWTLGSTTR